MASGEEQEEEEINRSFRNLGLEEDIDLDESFCLLELDGKDLCFVGFVYCDVARQHPGLAMHAYSVLTILYSIFLRLTTTGNPIDLCKKK